MSRKTHKERGSHAPAKPAHAVKQSITKYAANRDWAFALLLLAGLLLAYHPTWHGNPIWDDNDHLTRPELCSWAGLGRIWFDLGATQQYYPVTHGMFWLQHFLWGGSYTGYHLLNIFLHAISALLLLRILRNLEVRGAEFAAALWALHPVQVESVAWMSELKNTLSGVFYLGAALLYLRFDRGRSFKFYWLALGLFIAGLLTKSVIATLPAALLLVFYWKRGKLAWKNDVLPLVPFFIAGIASGLFTAWVERTLIGADGGNFHFPPLERCLIAGRAFWFYLAKLAWPAELIFIYPRWNVSMLVWWQYLFPVSAIALVTLLAAMRNKWGRGPLVAALFFAGTLFPALGFLNIYPFRYSFVADHFQYLACIGPIALASAGIAWIIDRCGKLPFLPPALGAGLLVVLGGLTWKQSAMYANAETLYSTTIARNPECWMAYNNLATELILQGRADEAIARLRAGLRLKPDFYEFQTNLGNALLQKGQAGEAVVCFREALKINPGVAGVHFNLANALLQQRQVNEAADEYRETLKIDSGYGDAHNVLGFILFNRGNTAEAIAHVQKALQLQPGDAGIENNLAWMLVTAKQTGVRDGAKAIELAGKANDTTGGKNPQILRTLAAAYAEAGQFPAAASTAGKALELAEAQSNAALAARLRADIQIYGAGRRLGDTP